MLFTSRGIVNDRDKTCAIVTATDALNVSIDNSCMHLSQERFCSGNKVGLLRQEWDMMVSVVMTWLLVGNESGNKNRAFAATGKQCAKHSVFGNRLRPETLAESEVELIEPPVAQRPVDLRVAHLRT